MAKKKNTTTKAKFKMNYIRNRIPAFKVPHYKGKIYEAFVPDTLDIQERISLAVNGLTGPTDPEKDHLLYFAVNFRSNPPSMSHGAGDICQVKFMEALPLMRLACGSKLNSEVDRVWMNTALKSIGSDGLFYWPSLPWAKYPDWCYPCPEGEDFYTMPIFCGRLIGAMTVYMQRDPNGPWEKEIKKVVDALFKIAIKKDDYAYFPQGGFSPNSKRVAEAQMPLGIWASLVGWTIHGLAQYHRVSKYKPAIDLASGLSRYLMYHGKYFDVDGAFLPNWAGQGEVQDDWDKDVQGFVPGPPPINNLIHFQHHMVPLLGVLEHALAAKDEELAEFVHRCFKWAKNKGCGMVGYFPEDIDNYNELETSETCEVAGMIGLALKLSQAGIGDYWDDADRWIRNQFAENQLLRSDWINHMAEAGLVTGKTRIPLSHFDAGSSNMDSERRHENFQSMSALSDTIEDVPQRNIGSFAGWPTANDWFVGHGSGIMHCCTGNGARALYYIWEHMLNYAKGVLNVNLLMNRCSKWADVNSHIPYTGKVDLIIKRACKKVRVRIPEWVKPKEVSCTLNNRKQKIEFDVRYIVTGPVKPNDHLSFTFPINERKEQIDIECQHYHLTIKGNEVVDIYPKGRFNPLYKRDHYRDNTTRWKETNRFVSEENIYW